MSTKIISWNVNGLRACVAKNTFYPFVEEEKPDILCLQETKLQEGQIELQLKDYHAYWNYAEKKDIPERLFFLNGTDFCHLRAGDSGA